MKVRTKKEFDAKLILKREVTVPAAGIDSVFYAHGQKTQENKVTKSFNYNPNSTKHSRMDMECEF